MTVSAASNQRGASSFVHSDENRKALNRLHMALFTPSPLPFHSL